MKRVACAATLIGASLALASDYAENWGPSTGTRIPAGEFVSHTGEMRTFLDLMGDKGLLVLFNRSANW